MWPAGHNAEVVSWVVLSWIDDQAAYGAYAATFIDKAFGSIPIETAVECVWLCKRFTTRLVPGGNPYALRTRNVRKIICCLTVGTVLLWSFIEPGFLLAESAKSLYKKGQAAEQRGDLETAYNDYSLSHDKAPADMRYKLALEHVRSTAGLRHVRRGEELEKGNQPSAALVEFLRALEIDPGNALAAQDMERVKREMDRKDNRAKAQDDGPSAEDLDKPGPPVHLDPLPNEPVTLHMTEDTRVLYETIARIAGISVIIDPEYVAKRVTINLKDSTPAEALRVLGDVSGTFWKASTHNTIFVAADTRAKRQQLEQMALKTFYLSNIAQPSDLNDVVTTVRNVIPMVKVFAVAGQNAIVVRATPDEILLAKQIIASLDLAKPEVLVDVYVMEVSRDKLRNMGFSPPTSLAVTTNSSSTSTTLNQIGRSSSYSYSIGQAAVEMLLTDSDTRVIENPSIRAVDGQKATLKVGKRIPIATGTYTTATSSSSSSVQTQFQYIDTGVALEITPIIHEDRDVTMKLAVEISSEDGTDTISGVTEPVIAQEKAEQMIRLKDGEVSILAGLMEDELTKTISGWPGVGEVPGLKYMFSTQQTERIKDDLVFMLIPHVVRAIDNNTGAAREIETGSGDTIRLNRISPQLAVQKR
jgi:general secretion pathway protein D